ncbi:MAG: peroxiredoxin (alkyl hydroperoxide reductase subunit C) [Oceanicoccus sp.]|jgi:peroxiredoxin (alkyl hydroperoxide reductase subunit C)
MNCHNDDEFQTVLGVGLPAPEFTAPAFHKGSVDIKVSLEDYRGKWVLLFFYPLDFTFVCPTELYELTALQSEFEAANCQILGASVDSVFSHQAWAEKDKKIGAIEFPIISDLSREVSFDYGVLHQEGMSLRGAFIIDPDGILQSMTVNNLNVGRNAEELLRLVKGFQTGDLCPASWDTGKDTLGKA